MFETGERICLIEDNTKRGRINEMSSDGVCEIMWDNGDIETLRTHKIQNEIIAQTPWKRLLKN